MTLTEQQERDIQAAAQQAADVAHDGGSNHDRYELAYVAGARWGIAYAQRWIPVTERMPEPGEPILALLERPPEWKQRHTRIRAMWIPQFFDSDLGEYDGDADYNEEKDEYYWPEGWYERNEFDERCWAVDGTVIAWQPLPPLVEVPHD